MAKIQVADFYYGAVLSKLFTHNIKIVLVESNDDRQVYDLTTNDGSYRLFMKYRGNGRLGVRGDSKSWQFSFSAADLSEIRGYVDAGQNLLLALVCGIDGYNGSELAILDCNEIKQCILNGKTTLSLSRKKGERAFRISVGGGRPNAIKIPCNRLVG